MSKYTIEYEGVGLAADDGTWHDFRVMLGTEEVCTCCMFIDSDGEVDENGLHFGDGADHPSEEHSDVDLSELQGNALSLIHP